MGLRRIMEVSVESIWFMVSTIWALKVPISSIKVDEAS
jgi:hypothetical protein